MQSRAIFGCSKTSEAERSRRRGGAAGQRGRGGRGSVTHRGNSQAAGGEEAPEKEPASSDEPRNVRKINANCLLRAHSAVRSTLAGCLGERQLLLSDLSSSLFICLSPLSPSSHWLPFFNTPTLKLDRKTQGNSLHEVCCEIIILYQVDVYRSKPHACTAVRQYRRS